MSFQYTTIGPHIIELFPQAEADYRSGKIKEEVEEVAQMRANTTGWRLDVYAANGVDVLFSKSPTRILNISLASEGDRAQLTARYKPAADKLKAALTKLGTDRLTIAKTLGEMGIKGIRQSATQCPISNYLLKEGLHKPNVCSSCIAIYEPNNVVRILEMRLGLTTELGTFIDYFDHGRFPELDYETSQNRSIPTKENP